MLKLLLLFLALPVSALEFNDAQHLLMRTGFGASVGEISQFEGLSRKLSVSLLINGIRSTPETELPTWYGKSRDELLPADADQKAVNQARKQWGRELKSWWVDEMIFTNSPFTEKLVLFWHDHFACSLQKVRWPQLMLEQNLKFRQHALDFRALLHAMLMDASLLIYLDANQSKKKKPNENFARELLELFTLGIGNYSEKDIQELARVLTGYKVNQKTGVVTFEKKLHDQGQKTVLGQTARFKPSDIVELLLASPETRKRIAVKVWGLFIDSEPNGQQIREMTSLLQAHDWKLKPLLEFVLNREEFWSPDNRGSRIKSPVDWGIGLLRTLGYHPENVEPVVQALRRSGQDLFDPPSVKGWDEGTSWITTSSLQQRMQIQNRFLRGNDAEDALEALKAMPPNNFNRLFLLCPPEGRVFGNPRQKLMAIMAENCFQIM